MMHRMLVCLSIIISIASSSNCSNAYTTTIGNATLPEKNDRMAVGYSAKTKTVVIVGGVLYPQQLLKFMVDTETFVDYNETYSPLAIEGSAPYYTQVDDTLWILSKSGDRFITLDLDTYDIQQTDITFQNNVTYGAACLTSYKQYLFIAGGDRWIHSIQIYNISDGKWLSNVPLLQVGRRSPACVVVNSVLYTIGGVDGKGNVLDSIETLYFNEESSTLTTGDIMNQKLNEPLRGSSAIQFGTDILVIGGTNDVEYFSDVTVIDTQSQSVAVCGSLSTAVAYAAAVIAEDVLYIFGGYNSKLPYGEWEVDSYQRISLSQLRTTAEPSSTSAPSSTSLTSMPSSNGTEAVTTALSSSQSTTSQTGFSPSSNTDQVSTALPSASDKSEKKKHKMNTLYLVMIIFGAIIVVGVVIFVVYKKRRAGAKHDADGVEVGFLDDGYTADINTKTDAYRRL